MTAHRVFERRRRERFRLPPMYSAVRARGCGADGGELGGHAYDISESGVRIELDEALAVGDQLHVELDLPCAIRTIRGEAKVIWVHDADDDPGPRRMALEFTGFDSDRDRRDLIECLGHGLQRVAA